MNIECHEKKRAFGPDCFSISSLASIERGETVKTSSILLTVAAGVLVTVASAAGGAYHLLKRIPVPGNEDHWDYVAMDSAARRVYISYGPHVLVMDADSDSLVGRIDKAPGFVHGIAIAPELGRGFISNGAAGTVTIFNAKTLTVLGEVKITGENPDAIVYDPATRRVFTFNAPSHNATALDASTNKVLGTIELGGQPEFASADGQGHLFVDLMDKGVVLQIDSRKLMATERWSTGECHRPYTMAIDRQNRRLFIGCRNPDFMAVLDANNGHVITTLPIGAGTDAAGFDPGMHLIFCSNTDGTLTVIRQESPDKYTILETVKTEVQARTSAVDLKTHKIFLSASDREPPSPATGNPFGALIPGTFRILVFGM